MRGNGESSLAASGNSLSNVGDLAVGRLPTLNWNEKCHDETLNELYRWVEGNALEAYTWYMQERLGKARASKVIRISAVALLTAGGIFPLLSLILHGSVGAEWGFVALAFGAGLLLLDRAFGFSSSWARYAGAAMELKAEVLRSQLKWAQRQATAIDRQTKPRDELLAALAEIAELADAVNRIVQDETARWSTDFHENLTELRANLGSHPR